ncbi:F-box/LRR-repeat protein [Populus alba x Populus x berolinensis]|uniref:F-box/LRR-repeat protein n=2 Tax=Populus TaxID=3689 RepID=A0AAD6Q606_9ROSI|nr:F-box/LRR-repeat protein [Populus alba x Populus x berolinensis]
MTMDRNIDMISNLPSSLLIIIAGFLSFKEAARTSVLSKQWLNIWRDAMHIQFNENFFVKSDEPEENQKVQREVFINFARQFIANYSKQDIKTLGLKCSKPGDFLADMQNIVMFASSRHVRELGLDFSDPTWREHALENHQAAFELPSPVYEHGRALKSLKLFSCSFDASNFSNFCALKTLSLGWIKINMGSIMAILESCPLLESLSLKRCWDIVSFEISKPGLRLKSLVIDECDIAEDFVLVEGPRLQFFKFSGNVGEFLLVDQSDLVKAELDFETETAFDEIGLFLCELLEDLLAAQVLTVCSVFLQIVPSGNEPLGLEAPIDVRYLILKTALHINEFCGIRFMLRSCPRLEILTIDIGPANIFLEYGAPYPFNPHEFWSENLLVEECVTTTLKAVNVKGFKGMMNELQVLKYLLHFGHAMEELNLCVSNEAGSNGETREFYMERAQQVLQFNKASRNLSIAIL